MTWHELFEDVLEGVPEYERFFTVDELDARASDLARRRPETVTLVDLGSSRAGRPIRALKIGSGKKAALMFGCPHPNEPIGAMMLDYFSERLAADQDLLRELDYTWYIVKCIDPDGTQLNEGWFAGPFNIETYVRNFYRPPGFQQVEWTFPIDYKTLHFSRPLPETRCLMKVIDSEKPAFLYSLHNAGFGGAYWYITHAVPELHGELHRIARRHGIPLSLGEPEVPYCTKFDEAIYGLFGVKDTYDYYEKHAGKDPASLISGGAGSDEYAYAVAGTFALVCELPYYYDPRIEDTSPTGRSRRDTVLESLDAGEKAWGYIRETYAKVRPLLQDAASPFAIAIEDNLKHIPAALEAERKWATTSEDLLRPATGAEAFDSLIVRKFYNQLSVGMLWRLCREELARSSAPERSRALSDIERELDEKLSRECSALEAELNYRVVPIRDLVRVQLASGLLFARHILGGDAV
ncbi:MAG: M14 family zinc carboxypeptidase [Bacillota bacterium]|nr:M14 family zinc carboxypeptidase [Bacillota bacterium]